MPRDSASRSARVKLAVALASLLAAAPAAAEVLSAGVAVQLRVGVNELRTTGRAPELGLELDLPPGRFGIYPALGAVAADDGSSHLYLCLARDFRFGERWVGTFFTGVAAYDPGREGLELGGIALYRSGLALSVRLSERVSTSLAWYHLSNAHLQERNPGTESLTFGLRWSAR